MEVMELFEKMDIVEREVERVEGEVARRPDIPIPQLPKYTRRAFTPTTLRPPSHSERVRLHRPTELTRLRGPTKFTRLRSSTYTRAV